MNGRKAKLIRKKVYRDSDFRDRKYESHVVKRIQIIGTDTIIPRITVTADTKRQIYQRMKKAINEESNSSRRRI